MARELGADHVLNVSGSRDAQALGARVRVELGGMWAAPRVALECSGADLSLNTAIHVSKVGGMGGDAWRRGGTGMEWVGAARGQLSVRGKGRLNGWARVGQAEWKEMGADGTVM